MEAASAVCEFESKVKLADLEDNMNLARLPDPGPKDLERLRKYKRAWERLASADDSTQG